MSKPIDKTDAVAKEQFARFDNLEYVDEGYKRDEKRIWKKSRTRHLRNLSKKELRDMQEDILPGVGQGDTSLTVNQE